MLIISDNVEQNLFLQWHKKTGTDYVATIGEEDWNDYVATIGEEDWNRLCGYNRRGRLEQILWLQWQSKTQTDSLDTIEEET